jgi:hypothetical protein
MLEDLSVHQQPLGTLGALPSRTEDWARYRLSDDQVHFFHAHGYLAGIRVLTDEQVDRLRTELQGLFDPSHPGNSTQCVSGCPSSDWGQHDSNLTRRDDQPRFPVTRYEYATKSPLSVTLM